MFRKAELKTSCSVEQHFFIEFHILHGKQANDSVLICNQLTVLVWSNQ